MERRSSWAYKSAADYRHGPNAHRYDPDAVEGHGHSPANPRWSPHFRARSAVVGGALLVEDGGVLGRGKSDVGWTNDVQLRGVVLRLSACDFDWKSEALTQSPRARCHQDILVPTLRSPPANPSNLDYQLLMLGRPVHRFRKNPPRQSTTRNVQMYRAQC